jgi:uncharacterized protein (AIM24 family)
MVERASITKNEVQGNRDTHRKTTSMGEAHFVRFDYAKGGGRVWCQVIAAHDMVREYLKA